MEIPGNENKAPTFSMGSRGQYHGLMLKDTLNASPRDLVSSLDFAQPGLNLQVASTDIQDFLQTL